MSVQNASYGEVDSLSVDGVSVRFSPEVDDVSEAMLVATGVPRVGAKVVVLQFHGTSVAIPVSVTPAAAGAGQGVAGHVGPAGHVGAAGVAGVAGADARAVKVFVQDTEPSADVHPGDFWERTTP